MIIGGKFMKSFKKIIGIFLAVSMLAACGKSNGEASKNKANETKVKKVVYTSFYPLESLTKYITGDKMEVKNFIPGLHLTATVPIYLQTLQALQ